MTTMAHLDAQVAEIVAAVERAGLTSRTTFFIVSRPRLQAGEAPDSPERSVHESRLLKATDGKIVQSDAYVSRRAARPSSI
jgi:hypothetical protein